MKLVFGCALDALFARICWSSARATSSAALSVGRELRAEGWLVERPLEREADVRRERVDLRHGSRGQSRAERDGVLIDGPDELANPAVLSEDCSSRNRRS
jgi:hypothetical protein